MTVLSFDRRERHTQKRASALLGAAPVLTFHAKAGDDPARCSTRTLRVGEDQWVAILSDRSQFIDRVRMGVEARFVLAPAGEIATVCGDAKVRVLGRTTDEDLLKLDRDIRQGVMALLDEQAFDLRDQVVVSIQPETFEIEADDDELFKGGVPRT